MGEKPHETTVSAWVALARAQRVGMACVEARLKAAGLPPLSWYDALWELEKAGEAGLRPFELERAMLFEQYNMSRLVDRLHAAGLVRRRACPGDRRGQMLEITAEGRALRRRMWHTYSQAIEDVVGSRLDRDEAAALSGLLRKLGDGVSA